MRAKEGRKESVPFPWSLAVQHQSLAFRARLYDANNEAPEEEAGWELFSKAKDSGISQNEDFQASCMEHTGLTNEQFGISIWNFISTNEYQLQTLTENPNKCDLYKFYFFSMYKIKLTGN